VQLGAHARGWISVRHRPEKRALLIELSQSLAPVLPALLGRVRNVFDLSARPDVIAAQLSRDPRLSARVALNPGLRVPGAFDGFELAVRAILGQQITVKAATTIAGRFVGAFGEPVVTPHADVDHLAPTPQRIATSTPEELGALGIIGSRARSIIALAQETVSGRLRLEPGASPEETISQLVALPGIGAWTAHYIAMRALRWPDAFPKEDVVLRKHLGGVTAAEAEALSQAWRPWRSYATLHLWQGAVVPE
jgi:AraC family transcriptional regulator of adaptative response / DNA-3-methyladenine glycosylase II